MKKELPNLKKHCGIPFGFKKKKKSKLSCFQSRGIYCFCMIFSSILGTERPFFICFADCDLRESRLPWLDRVLLCFVGVELK